ncbi:HpcH/HpaI aldolase/citrate lyase family protein [Candidatus Fermentibacterales bacterium]|nr:HpcH/HpaI aldolase/citrate lyase family protein [Candidatus Fermentibacterales bacterium]
MSFTTGHSGPRIKDDCLVSFTPDDSPLRIGVVTTTEGADESRVETAASRAAERLGIRSGDLRVEDCGAEPWVVAARVEAALMECFPRLPRPTLPPATAWTESSRHRPRRSRLYLPGDNPRFLAKGAESGADGVILDLEDSVPPSRKSEARVLVAHALSCLDFGRSEVMVRINQGETGLEDLEWIVPQPVHLVLVPKVEYPSRVEEVSRRIARIGKRCGRHEKIWLMPIVESPLGVLDALEIAGASPSNVALTIGLQDLSAEMGVMPTDHGRESFVARSLIVLAARAAGLQPIDTVYADVKNEEGLLASIAAARELGFVGKGCIHPSQVQPVNQGFLPSREEIEKAMKVVLAMEEAERQGLGAIALGSKMIDPPVAAQARNLIENAISMDLLGPDWRDSAG